MKHQRQYKVKKAIPNKRNPIVRIARQRNGAGFMKDKRTRRGGSRNQQADWLAEWEDDEYETENREGAQESRI